MRLKGQYNAELTFSLCLHVKPLITAIKAIPVVKYQHSVNRLSMGKSVKITGHLQVTLHFCFKTSLHAKMNLICMKMNLTGRTHFHMNGFCMYMWSRFEKQFEV